MTGQNDTHRNRSSKVKNCQYQPASDMGNEQAVAKSRSEQPGFQGVNANVVPSSISLNQDVVSSSAIHYDYKMMIAIRGTRKTGKTTLVTRMRGFPFDEGYQPTMKKETTEITWKSPSKENVLVTVLDIIDKNVGKDDEAFKKSDGLVVMIDYRSPDSIDLAEKIIRLAPDDLPLVVFSNFMDSKESDPVIPTKLMQYMGRFFYIPGSMKSNMGLIELSKWLSAPLILAKMKIVLEQSKEADRAYETLKDDLYKNNNHFLDLASARKYQPRNSLESQKAGKAAPSSGKTYVKAYKRRQMKKVVHHNPAQAPQAQYEDEKIQEDNATDDDFWGDGGNTTAPEVKPRVLPKKTQEELKPNPNVRRYIKPSMARRAALANKANQDNQANQINRASAPISSEKVAFQQTTETKEEQPTRKKVLRKRSSLNQSHNQQISPSSSTGAVKHTLKKKKKRSSTRVAHRQTHDDDFDSFFDDDDGGAPQSHDGYEFV